MPADSLNSLSEQRESGPESQNREFYQFVYIIFFFACGVVIVKTAGESYSKVVWSEMWIIITWLGGCQSFIRVDTN